MALRANVAGRWSAGGCAARTTGAGVPGSRSTAPSAPTCDMKKGRTAAALQLPSGPRSRSARSSLGRTLSFGSWGSVRPLALLLAADRVYLLEQVDHVVA